MGCHHIAWATWLYQEYKNPPPFVMFFFLPYLGQNGWCGCVLSASTATASSTVWLLTARLQASASFRCFAPLILCLVRQVLGLKAFSCLRCMAQQPEVYPVPGAGKQVLPCIYPCSLLSCVSLADHYRSYLGFASGARLFSASPPPLSLGGVALGLAPSCALALPCFSVRSIVQLPRSKSSSYRRSSLRIR